MLILSQALILYVQITSIFLLTRAVILQVHAILLLPRVVISEECGGDDARDLFS
jgi:hypothetical protein